MRAVEDHEERERLVTGEAVVGVRCDEYGLALRDVPRLSLDLEVAFPFEHDVDLVVRVRRLAVRPGATSTYTPISKPGDSWTTS